MAAVIYITLGNNASFGIDEKDHLVVTQDLPGSVPQVVVDLGLATQRRIEQLQDYLGQLYIHAIEENVVAGEPEAHSG
jgi:hypothetical protein